MVKVELYGGAMEVELDPLFGDLSIMRDIPDHQEVYVCKESARSIMFEILGHEDAVSDSDSFKHYFLDLAKANGDNNAEILESRDLSKEETPLFTCDEAYSVHVGRGIQRVAKYKEEVHNEVGVSMIVIRVAGMDFNFLISLNSPKKFDEASQDKVDRIYTWEEDKMVIDEILRTFKVVDWGVLA